MPSHGYLDAITKEYFSNVSPEQFEKDRAEASPPVPAEAINRPAVRGPRAPAQRKRSPARVGEIYEARIRLLEEKVARLEERPTSEPPPRQREKQANIKGLGELTKDVPGRETYDERAPQNNVLPTIASSQPTVGNPDLRN